MLREDFLRQSAFDDTDAYTSMKKQAGMLGTILHFSRAASNAVQKGVQLDKVSNVPVRAEISRMKGISEKEFEAHEKKLKAGITKAFNDLIAEESQTASTAVVEAKKKS